jgi:hypothetical protein
MLEGRDLGGPGDRIMADANPPPSRTQSVTEIQGVGAAAVGGVGSTRMADGCACRMSGTRERGTRPVVLCPWPPGVAEEAPASRWRRPEQPPGVLLPVVGVDVVGRREC